MFYSEDSATVIATAIVCMHSGAPQRITINSRLCDYHAAIAIGVHEDNY
jgi:hypothetical protein